MPRIDDTLCVLRDVQGVLGSFVFTSSGALAGRDLPAVFDNDVLSEVGPRVARLHETFLSAGEDLDACVLRFADYKLYFRKVTGGFIGVLSAIGVNMAALRMAANLVIRRIDPELARLSAAPPPVAPAPPNASTGAGMTSARAPFSVPVSTPAPTPAPPPLPTGGVIVPQDGRDASAPVSSERHARVYRGRRVDE